jgi:CelD/BcsL family acetyltransferase involved in cellulose biosynthesis
MRSSAPSGNALRVERYGRVAEVDAEEWDRVVAGAGAPVFYRSAFLDAYERSGLSGAEATVYLVLRDAATANAAAVLPLYLLPEADPLRWLPPAAVPGGAVGPGSRALLSHGWHCYDTWLPGMTPGEHRGRVVAEVDRIARSLAVELEAELFGFVDVGASNPLGAVLNQWGYRASHIETRWQLDLAALGGEPGYLDSLSRNTRKSLLRYQRRAAEQGARVVALDPVEPWLEAIVELCWASASKFGNGHFYRRDALTRFLRLAEPLLRIIGVRYQGRLVAVSISLLDGDRFHTWAGGADYEAGEGFSPNYLLTHEEILEALRSGATILEGGRTNGAFKSRFGMTPEPVYAHLAAPGAGPA